MVLLDIKSIGELASNNLKEVFNSQKCFHNWKKIANKAIQNQWFHILENDNYFTLEYNQPQVVILPIVDGKNIIIVKVKRPVIDSATWELPAGGIERGETIEDGALRELKEETGVLINDKKRLKPMNTLVVSPTRMPMFPSLFSINISREEFQLRQSHDDEIEKVGLFSFQEIRQMILNEEIFVSLPLAILSRFLLS